MAHLQLLVVKLFIPIMSGEGLPRAGMSLLPFHKLDHKLVYEEIGNNC